MTPTEFRFILKDGKGQYTNHGAWRSYSKADIMDDIRVFLNNNVQFALETRII